MNIYLPAVKPLTRTLKQSLSSLILTGILFFASGVFAQMPFSSISPTAGSSSAFAGTLGSGPVTVTVTPTISGCYGYGMRYKNSENGFAVTNGACTPTSPNPWTASVPVLSNGNKTVTLTANDQSAVGCSAPATRTWSAVTLTLTITSSGTNQVWTVNTTTGDISAPVSNAGNLVFTYNETALRPDGTTGPVNQANPFTGCASTYMLCSHLVLGWFTYTPTTLTPSNNPLPFCVGSTLNLLSNPSGSVPSPSNGPTFTYSWTGPNAFTSSAQDPSIANASPAAAGTYTVNLTDNNNCISIPQTTTAVVETTPPTLSCPANQILTTAPGLCTQTYTIADPITDNCAGATWGYSSTGATTLSSSGNTIADGTSSGSLTFDKGSSIITVTGTDPAGNTAVSCAFTVTVNDAEAPVITCPANISQNTNPVICAAIVNYTAPVGTDNCPGAATLQTAGLPSGAVFPTGTTTNTFVVTDLAGNTASCSFTVTVIDSILPVISCPSNIAQNTNPAFCGALVVYVTPLGTDNCPGAATTQTAGLPSGSIFPTGTTTNTFMVTDSAGNTASCSFNVTVTDSIAPVIVCPLPIVQGSDAGTCGAVVNYTAPVGTDNCPGAVTTQTAGLPSGATFPTGTTTNTFMVTDSSGNTAACSFNVTVIDSVAPVIVCPSNIAQNSDPGICGAVVNYTAPVGTDNCPGATTTQTTGLPSGSTFPTGVTLNTFTVTDSAGNVAACSFTVTITDSIVPVITCPANISQNTNPVICAAIVNYTAPVGTDNCPGAATLQTAGLPSGALFPTGTTTNTFVVTDLAGNTASCSFTVTVIDSIAPVISCPSNIAQNTNPAFCGALVVYVTPLGTDNCPGAATTQTAGLPSGSIFPTGTTTNTFMVTDSAGNTASCSFNVTVTDSIAPVIVCPLPIVQGSDAGTCGAVVNYTAPVGTDNCPGAVTTQTAGLPSGATFPTGTTTNTFMVTDSSGNTATCSFNVTVIDSVAPVIVCPSNIAQNSDPGICGAVVNYTAPVGTDNCPGAVTTQTTGLPSGSTFPTGVTLNSFTVTDSAGNVAACSFTVTITDSIVPVITCPANISQNTNPVICAAIVNYTAPVGTDNCPGAATLQTAGLPSGALFPTGTTTNTFVVTDLAGNTASCSFTVTVIDSIAPVISCPSNIAQNTNPAFCGALVVYVTPLGTDNCPGAATTQTAGLPSGSIFPTGTTTNTFMVTDSAGNTASCSFNVTVTDSIAPVIVCPLPVVQGSDAGTCGAVVNYTAPVGTDNCPGAVTTQTAGLPSGATFPTGTTTNTFMVTDSSGNTATCSFNVTVIDSVAPVIVCPSNIAQNSDAGICGAVVNYTAPVGTDNCPGATTTQTAGLPSGSTFPTGVTLNTFTVTDSAGNVAACSFTVTITDSILPVITCPANISQNTNPVICAAIVNYTAPVGTDNCPGAATLQTAGLPSGAVFPTGTTTNTFVVTDLAGNTASCSFTVTVIDSIAPVISCPSNIAQNTNPAFCGALVVYVTPVGTDNCPGAATTQTAGLPSGAIFPTGTTTNTFMVTDSAGNTASCSFNVTVTDSIAPVIVCPLPVVQGSDAGTCGAVVNYTAPVGTDNCPGAVTTQTAGLPSGSTFPTGTTTNTFMVTDSSGNTATCSFNVTVIDSVAPVIVCPSNIAQNSDAGICGAVVNYTAPVGTDNCPGATTTQTTGLPSGSTFPTGVTLNTFTVTDSAGNVAACSFIVTITDSIVPVITCPANISQNTNPVICAAIVNYTAPVGTDNCPGAATLQTAGLPSGAVFPTGTTTNTFVVTDLAGNTASCSFTVTVIDSIAPVISCPGNIAQNTNPAFCGALVVYVTPLGTDNCPGAATTQTAGLPSGSVFPTGTTTNTFMVTDSAGNTASCSFNVTVTDSIAPVIVCPLPIVQGSDAGTCGAVVNYTAPVGTDNCPGAVTTQTAGLPSGATFPTGTTTNTFMVTDSSGNTATCSFNVTVIDSVPPVIVCPSNIAQNSDPGICGAVVNYTAPVGTDNCPGATTTQTTGLPSGSTFPTGVTLNTFTVTDSAGNVAACSFTVTITDSIVPVITCPANISQNTNPVICAAIVNYTAPVGTDNCPGAATLQTAGLPSGAVFPTGTTTNTFVVTDLAGNTASCSFTVTVIDSILPVISCPSNIAQNTNPAFCGALVVYVTPLGTDNCPGAATTQTAGLPSGSIFPTGTTTNTFMVTDSAGNTASCSFNVTVTDSIAPVIVCPLPVVQGSDAGTCGAVVNYTAPVGTDNCPGAVTTQTAGLPSGATFPTGTTTNTFMVTDSSGNTATCSFNVTVIDSVAPVIVCPSNIAQNSDPGICGAVVNYTAPVGTDNCPGAVTTQTTGLPSGSTFPTGVTLNTFTVTDSAGNVAACSFTVTITDSILPVITCPANISQNTNPVICAAIVNYTAPVGTDNCPGAATLQTAGLPSGAVFPTGTTTNTFVVTDLAGNTVSCSFTVTVIDSIAPVISCPGNIAQNTNPAFCGALVVYVTPLGTDNCPGAATTQTAGLPSGSIFPTGTTTNTFMVTDSAGNTASCSFNVTVTDVQPPTISCPADTMVSAIAGCSATITNLGTPTTSDNCGIAGVTNNHPSTSYPVGVTIVTWTATDNSGNTATCIQAVTVTPVIPSISSNSPVCEGDAIILTATNIPGATSYTWYGPLGTVLDSTLIPTFTIPNSTIADAGVYGVTVRLNNCTSVRVSTIVVIKPKPATPTVDTIRTVCEGGSFTLCAHSTDTAAIFNWYGPNGFSPANCVTVMNANTAQSGIYTVVTTLNGCRSDTTSVLVIVNAAPKSDSIGSNSPLCEHQTLQLFDSIPDTTGIDSHWTGPNGFTSTQQNPAILNATLFNQGFYTVVLTNRTTGCTSTPYTTLVEISAFPDTLVADNSGAVCEGGSVTLNVTGVFGANYLWTGPNGYTATGKNPVLSPANPAMSGVYTAVVSLPGGCSDSAKTNVTVYPSPIVNTGSDTSINQGTLLQLHGTMLDGFGNTIPFPLGTTFNWSPNTLLDRDYIPDPVADFSNLPAANPYLLRFTVRDQNGCKGSDSLYVTVLPGFALVIPNVISPNGDGLNDTWKLTFIDNYNANNIEYLVQIFARGGALVYSSSNYNNADGFNGTVNGTTLPEGAYWYIITTPGKTYKGALHIVR